MKKVVNNTKKGVAILGLTVMVVITSITSVGVHKALAATFDANIRVYSCSNSMIVYGVCPTDLVVGIAFDTGDGELIEADNESVVLTKKQQHFAHSINTIWYAKISGEFLEKLDKEHGGWKIMWVSIRNAETYELLNSDNASRDSFSSAGSDGRIRIKPRF